MPMRWVFMAAQGLAGMLVDSTAGLPAALVGLKNIFAQGSLIKPTMTKSAMEKPRRNFFLKMEEYMNTSLMSSMGPNTRKASFAALATPLTGMAIGAAMKASDVLQSASTKARPIIEGMAT